MKIFKVYLNKKWIDTVFYSELYKITPEEIKKALVEHDGYNSNIEVKSKRRV